MVRLHADQGLGGAPPPDDSTRKEIAELKQAEDESRQRRPGVVATTYKYLSDGVRLLGEAYSIYDDRNIQ